MGEVSDKVTEKNKDNEFNETLTNSAEYGIISQRDFFDKDISNSKNLDTYYVVRPNDFVYNPRISNSAPVGPIKRNTLRRTGVMSPLYYVFRLFEVEPLYVEKYFETTYWHTFMQMNGDSGVRSDRFNIRDSLLEEMPIPLPNACEQTAIGNFFNTLDIIVTLHKRKLDGLKELRNGYLQRMFLQNGKYVPRLRFSGLEGSWIEQKLGDVLEVSIEKNRDNLFKINDVLSVSREAGVVNQIEYQGRSFAGADITNYKVVKNGDLIYTKSPLKGAPYGIFQVSLITGIVSPLYAVYNSTEIAYAPYVAMGLKNDSIAEKYLAPLVSKGAKNTINITDIGALNGTLLIPTMDEQVAIFDFFHALDNVINARQNKLDKLIRIKQAYLQKMFV